MKKSKSSEKNISFKAGFYLPGLFAMTMYKPIENGEPKTKIIQRWHAKQLRLDITCPECSSQFDVRMFSRDDAAELYELGRRSTYEEFYEEFERRFKSYEVRCESCGLTAELNPWAR